MENASKILVGLPHGKVPHERAAEILIAGGPAGIALLADDPTKVGDLLLDELDMYEDNETMELCRRVSPGRNRFQQVRGHDLVRWEIYTPVLGTFLNELSLRDWSGLAYAYDPSLTLGTSLQQARVMAPPEASLTSIAEAGGPSLLGVLLEGVLHTELHLSDTSLRGIWLAGQTLDDDHLASVLLVTRRAPADILALARESAETIRSALVLSRSTTKAELDFFEADPAPEVQRALRARRTWSGRHRSVHRTMPQAS